MAICVTNGARLKATWIRNRDVNTEKRNKFFLKYCIDGKGEKMISDG